MTIFQKVIKKEPKGEEEEEEEEEKGKEEEEVEGAGGKVLSVEEEWKLQHIEAGRTEPLEKLGKPAWRCYTLVVSSDSVAHCTYTYVH